MKILLATSNPHKLDEIVAVFREEGGATASAFQIVTLDDLGLRVPEPVEDQPTFEGNAALKARYYARAGGLPCLADDSGLEVDALGGAPGVMSARYAGAQGPRAEVDRANNQRLLRELGNLPAKRRTARFVCAMALAIGMDPIPLEASQSPGGPPLRPGTFLLVGVRGTIEGRILGPGDEGYALDNPAGRGSHGFGYDPLFLVPGLGQTTAELTPQEKNRISHRGAAARLMWRELQRISGRHDPNPVSRS